MRTQSDHSRKRHDAVILLNPFAGGATALRKWRRIREAVLPRFGEIKLEVLDRQARISQIVQRLHDRGHRRFVAGGGDGTVNELVHALMAIDRSDGNEQLGAMALGSSNDYHKPVRDDHQIDGVSCKIDFNSTRQRDVGVLDFEDEQGQWQTRHWIVNAGLGITADANAFFNRPNGVLELLKPLSTATAILYAAIRTIVHFCNQDRLLKLASQPWTQARVTNLGVVKSPHFSGDFCYDSDFVPDNGRFHVHLCEDMSLPTTLYTLWQLSRNRFSELPQTRSWRTNRLAVGAEDPFPVEYDGEVIYSRNVAFSICSRRLEVCI